MTQYEIKEQITFTLTTNHAASSYGIPVLVDEDGNAYGPDDVICTGETAREFVQRAERGELRAAPVGRGGAPMLYEHLEDESIDPINPLTATDFTKSFLSA